MDEEERGDRAAKCRETAVTLRMLAGRLPYDFNQRAQLHALADGFDRWAERLEREDREHRR